MARLFKFIFHVLLLTYIAIALALVVPPLVGVTTATVLEETDGNQAIGTVDYAKRIPLEELTVGDQILVTGSEAVNVYTVQAVDVEKATVTVANAENQEIPVRSYVYRMVLAVPFIGYVLVALQTMEGIIVLAMIAILLILLCILTGIWSRKAKEKRRKKKELKAQKKAEKKNRKTNKAEDSVDEAEEDDIEEAAAPIQQRQVMNAATAGNDRMMDRFAAQPADVSKLAPDEEYEDFPPKAPVKTTRVEVPPVSAPKMPETQNYDYFDDEEDNEDVDSWLHDDVDDDELYAGLNNRAASESLMATARLFAINRAAQAKESMASVGTQEPLKATKVVAPEEVAAVNAKAAKSALVRTEIKATDPQKKASVKEITVDKVVNLKELEGLDEDTQQIVLTINIKVLSE